MLVAINFLVFRNRMDDSTLCQGKSNKDLNWRKQVKTKLQVLLKTDYLPSSTFTHRKNLLAYIAAFKLLIIMPLCWPEAE